MLNGLFSVRNKKNNLLNITLIFLVLFAGESAIAAFKQAVSPASIPANVYIIALPAQGKGTSSSVSVTSTNSLAAAATTTTNTNTINLNIGAGDEIYVTGLGFYRKGPNAQGVITCAAAPAGTFLTTPTPAHGTIRNEIQMGNLDNIQGCPPGIVEPYTLAYYKWTDGSPIGTSDNFTLTYSNPDSLPGPDYTIKITLVSRGGLTNDKGASNPAKDLGDCHPGGVSCGDPIDLGSGNVFEKVTDYETSGSNKLSFIRYYNSLASSLTYAHALGGHWRSNYDRYLNIISATSVMAERADGKVYPFTLVAGVWKSDGDVDVKLSQSGSTWTLIDNDDTTETYNVVAGTTKALLKQLTYRGGYTQNLQYDASNSLLSVTDSYNRSLKFTYNGPLLSSLLTPDGGVYAYNYDSSDTVPGINDRLVSVLYPIDGSYPALRYEYWDAGGSTAFLLSGVVDSSGNDISVWSYNFDTGRAISNQSGNGADKISIVYNTDGTRKVTNAFGVVDTYTFSVFQNVPKVTRIDRAATATTAAASRTFTYDANGFKASETDWNGNVTKYVNDAHGQPTSITEANGTPVARTTTITYNNNFHVPATIVTPGLTSSYTYDVAGNLLTKTLKDTTATTVPYSTNGQSRVWTYTWANALLSSIKDPATNLTSLSYDATGALTKITNALSQSTSITTHTAGGYPQVIADANGVTTTLTYDPNMRVSAHTLQVGANQNKTQYSYAYYSDANALTRTLDPDGVYFYNTFDAAHRITKVANAYGGNKIYTLDAMGHPTQVTVQNGTSLYQKHSATYDALGRILKDIGANNQTTVFAYDNNGNNVKITDPLTNVTTQTFDALNRIATSTNAIGSTITKTYDAHDRTLSVADVLGHTTRYVYNGFGDLIQDSSPDRGTRVYKYDVNGNLIQLTDAKGIVSNRTYDALNRVKTITYPASSAENVTFTYDEANHGKGIGRLTTIVDAAGTLSRSYEEHGSVSSETRTKGGVVLNTSYGYSAAGRLGSITYPSGAQLSYTYALDGTVSLFPFKAGTSSWNGQAIYQHFGSVSALYSYTYPTQNFYYDLDGQMTTTTVQDSQKAWMWQNYSYDANGNLTATSRETSANNEAFYYDAVNRLTATTGNFGGGGYRYRYDLVGNRTDTTSLAGVVNVFSYASGTNRLNAVDGTTVTSDANGSITGFSPALAGGVNTLVYNNAGRLSAVKTASATLGSYLYDAFGRRTVKTTGSTGAFFVYDPSGQLLEETDATGKAITDYAYVDGRVVGAWQVQKQQMVAVYTDRLGVPLIANDKYGLTAWKADYEPFGATNNIVTSNAYTGPVVQNTRLPGQYTDAESGFSQNGFRDYVPQWGRYLESDPIGLAGGMNTYAYVSGNPLKYTDRLGLEFDSLGGNVSPATAQGLGAAQSLGIPTTVGPNIVGQMAEAYAYAMSAVAGLPEWGAGRVAGGAACEIYEGMSLYRVFGGEGAGMGRSWTPINPASVDNYRTAAGLFPGNSGTHIIRGTLNNLEGVTTRTALPGPGGVGGTIPEIVVPTPATQVTPRYVGGVNPPY